MPPGISVGVSWSGLCGRRSSKEVFECVAGGVAVRELCKEVQVLAERHERGFDDPVGAHLSSAVAVPRIYSPVQVSVAMWLSRGT